MRQQFIVTDVLGKKVIDFINVIFCGTYQMVKSVFS